MSKGRKSKSHPRRRPSLVRKHRRPPVGARPGDLAPDACQQSSLITVIDYNLTTAETFTIQSVEELSRFRSTERVSWIDIQGLGDAQTLQRVAAIFGIHHLTLADAVNIPTRAKSEFYDDAFFVVSDVIFSSSSHNVLHEQFSLFVGPGFVITFQEHPGDSLDPIRIRIRESKGSIRRQGSDYLAAAILDTLIDGYFPVLERLGELLEELEDEVIHNSSDETISKIHRSRRDLLGIRRALWPLREALSGLLREEHPLINPANKMYLRDSYEHVVQLLDITETYRELCAGLTDVYLSSVSNRLNEVMKILTVIATIFIPLSFFASVYGMNFEHFPELKWQYGYLYFWIAMLSAASLMLGLFIRSGWIGLPRWWKKN